MVSSAADPAPLAAEDPTLRVDRSAADGAATHLALEDYLPYLINRAGVSLVHRFGAVLREEELGIQDWRVLVALQEFSLHAAAKTGMRLSDLSLRTAIEISTLSRVVANMEKAHLLHRERDGRDARAVSIRLTPRGLSMAAKLMPSGLALEQAALAGLDAAETRQLKDLLRRVYRNLTPEE